MLSYVLLAGRLGRAVITLITQVPGNIKRNLLVVFKKSGLADVIQENGGGGPYLYRRQNERVDRN